MASADKVAAYKNVEGGHPEHIVRESLAYGRLLILYGRCRREIDDATQDHTRAHADDCDLTRRSVQY